MTEGIDMLRKPWVWFLIGWGLVGFFLPVRDVLGFMKPRNGS